jgi:hypothetical protein
MESSKKSPKVMLGFFAEKESSNTNPLSSNECVILRTRGAHVFKRSAPLASSSCSLFESKRVHERRT